MDNHEIDSQVQRWITPSYFKESIYPFKFSPRRVDRPVDNAMNNLGD